MTTPSAKMGLSNENVAYAKAAKERVGGDVRRVVLIIGTGVSKGMTRRRSEGNRLCDWSEIVTQLSDQLDDCSEKRALDAIQNARIELSTPVTLGLAHMIREKLEESDSWDRAVREIVTQVRMDFDQDTAWSRFFRAMGTCSSAGSLSTPIVLTTNYDPLLTIALGARALTNPDLRRDRESEGFTMWKRETESEVPPYLDGILEVPLIWDLHRRGLLTHEDAFVHHVHGAALFPPTMVFDAADYERAILGLLWEPLAAMLAKRNIVAIFAGVGDGMFDRHFSKMWAGLKRKCTAPMTDNPCAYWLVGESDLKKYKSKLADMTKHEKIPKDAIQIVSETGSGAAIEEFPDDGFAWMPFWINEAIGNVYNFHI